MSLLSAIRTWTVEFTCCAFGALVLAAALSWVVQQGPRPDLHDNETLIQMQLLIERENRNSCSAFYASSFGEEKCNIQLITSQLGIVGLLYSAIRS